MTKRAINKWFPLRLGSWLTFFYYSPLPLQVSHTTINLAFACPDSNQDQPAAQQTRAAAMQAAYRCRQKDQNKFKFNYF